MTDAAADWQGYPNDDGHSLAARFPDLTGRVRMLWHSGYWDGPLSGYVTLDGVPGHWVCCVQDHWNERAPAITSCCTGACTCCHWSDIGEGLTCCPDYREGRECCQLTWDRLYLVYRLDAEQDRLLLARHALFCEHVGTHSDYTDGGRDLGSVKSQATWPLFYEADHPSVPPLREDQVVGTTTNLFPEPPP